MSKIFLSIACFMDPDVINTIDDCLKRAKNPKNITIGVCLQYDPDDYFFKKYENHSQVKLIKIHYSEAKGPAYARYKLYKLFSNEDFFFQIDCHSRFYDNWDEKIIECYNECLKINKKVIISYYPENIDRMKDNSQLIANISTVRCIDEKMGIKTHGIWIPLKDCPKKSWGISAAMLFFDKVAHNDIVFDDEIYFGEQFEEQVVLAARYWTRGYDIFTPSKHIISTEYITNKKRQKKSLRRNKKEYNETYEKLCHIMKLKYNKKYENCEKSKLGNVRTIEDYYKMLNIYDKVKNTYPNNYLNDNNSYIFNYNNQLLKFNYIEGDWISKSWEKNEFYELRLLEKIRSLNIKGVYIDVGAHHGNHSIYFDKFCPSEKVISIEGNPYNFNYLKQNINNNCKNVILHNIIVNDNPGDTLYMKYSKNNTGNSWVVKNEINSGCKNISNTLDNLLINEVNISLIKVDIKNYEYYALLGAVNVIEKYKPIIIIELHKTNPFYENIIDFLTDRKYFSDNISLATSPTYIYTFRG